MTDGFQIVHDPTCREPLNQHTGSESCIRVVFPEEPQEISPAYYKQSVQGGSISDHHADYVARYGSASDEPLKSTLEDRRDNRDPSEVGKAYLDSRYIPKDPPSGPARWGSD
jgi:hypothetical protein